MLETGCCWNMWCLYCFVVFLDLTWCWYDLAKVMYDIVVFHGRFIYGYKMLRIAKRTTATARRVRNKKNKLISNQTALMQCMNKCPKLKQTMSSSRKYPVRLSWFYDWMGIRWLENVFSSSKIWRTNGFPRQKIAHVGVSISASIHFRVMASLPATIWI